MVRSFSYFSVFWLTSIDDVPDWQVEHMVEMTFDWLTSFFLLFLFVFHIWFINTYRKWTGNSLIRAPILNFIRSIPWWTTDLLKWGKFKLFWISKLPVPNRKVKYKPRRFKVLKNQIFGGYIINGAVLVAV